MRRRMVHATTRSHGIERFDDPALLVFRQRVVRTLDDVRPCGQRAQLVRNVDAVPVNEPGHGLMVARWSNASCCGDASTVNPGSTSALPLYERRHDVHVFTPETVPCEFTHR